MSRRKTAVKVLKGIATLFMLVILFLSVAPFSVSVYTIGSFLPIVVFGAILLMWYVPGLKNKIKSIKTGRVLYTIISVLMIIGLCYSAVVGTLILSAETHRAKNENKTTLVVLGCQVFGTNPSLMLLTRLDAAKKFLDKNPDSPCVLSGGKGTGEAISEAEAMKQYLVSVGISEDRLYLEDNSHSTFENLAFSKELIEKENLPRQIVITTNEFHLYRSGLIAEKAGLESYSNPAKTPWHLYTCHFIREILAVTKHYAFG